MTKMASILSPPYTMINFLSFTKNRKRSVIYIDGEAQKFPPSSFANLEAKEFIFINDFICIQPRRVLCNPYSCCSVDKAQLTRWRRFGQKSWNCYHALICAWICWVTPWWFSHRQVQGLTKFMIHSIWLIWYDLFGKLPYEPQKDTKSINSSQ